MLDNKGFTLVELSIVLVIIGLLIGGILVGQSLIDSAKLSSQVRQLSQFDAAVMSFKSRYGDLPGDAKAFGGDGDGIIGRSAISGPSDSPDANGFGDEIENFWPQAFPKDFSPQPYDSSMTPAIAGENVPAAELGNSGNLIMASAIGIGPSAYWNSDNVNIRNFYTIFSLDNIITTAAPIPGLFRASADGSRALTPIQLLSLDKKMDDGAANAGFVISGRVVATGGCVFDDPQPTCSSGANYLTANEGYECTPMIRIGGSFGAGQ